MLFSTLDNPNSSSEMVEFDWLTDLDGWTLGEKGFASVDFGWSSAALYTAFSVSLKNRKTKPQLFFLKRKFSQSVAALAELLCLNQFEHIQHYSPCSFNSMSETRMFFSASSEGAELVRLYRALS